MTELSAEPYLILAADLGEENPLPRFRDRREDHPVGVHESVPPEDARHIGWRSAYRVLPYRMQDGYNRQRTLRELPSLVLQNEYLRATVLAGLGGRLVSLVHRTSGRELLHRNPWFQPANLALRDAWFSGGVEWNLPHLGHHYLTCSPVFAAKVRGCHGEPVLRIYEWDRLKGIPWQVDLSLPPGSPFLFARVRVINPRSETIPMYWWSNIAVDEAPDVRVLVPADSALGFPHGSLTLTPLPDLDGVDVTYTTRLAHAQEYFFRIDKAQRPWVAALDRSGSGLFQCSTARLRGRKMFLWGTHGGGRRWQEYLGGPGAAYLEIQAGLGRTQLESVPMPANADWSWTEAYGVLQAEPAEVHSPDWQSAWRSADQAIEQALPSKTLAEWDQRLGAVTDRTPEGLLSTASGWGALEIHRSMASGEPNPIPAAMPFPDTTLGQEQAPWLQLLETGVLPVTGAARAAACPEAPVPAHAPGAWMIQPEWEQRLRRSVQAPEGDHWLAWLHLGVMRAEALDADGAAADWTRSLERERTGWSLRNLGAVALLGGDTAAACEWLRQAWETGPRVAALAVEYASLLVKLGKQEQLRVLVHSLPASFRSHERIRILQATAALDEGRLDEVAPLFEGEFSTIREGETVLTDLWYRYHEQRLAAREHVLVDEALRTRVRAEFPPPLTIDYRMG